jgi:hypothetical protein
MRALRYFGSSRIFFFDACLEKYKLKNPKNCYFLGDNPIQALIFSKKKSNESFSSSCVN